MPIFWSIFAPNLGTVASEFFLILAPTVQHSDPLWLFHCCSPVNNRLNIVISYLLPWIIDDWLNIVVWFVILWISDCLIVALLNNWLKSVPLDERLHWTNIRYGWSTIEQPHGSFLCRNLYLWYIYTSQAKLGCFVHILKYTKTQMPKWKT